MQREITIVMFEAGVQLYNFMETFFCCTVNQKEEFKSLVTEHMLVYVIQGELDVLYNDRRHHLHPGQAYLIRKNHKAHKIEYPSADGTPFKGLSDAGLRREDMSLINAMPYCGGSGLNSDEIDF